MNTIVRRIARLAVLPLALVLLATACQPPKGTVDSVDVERYAGTWYEIASIKQFFSVGLVNTTAEYTVQDDGSIRVVNSGRYLAANGPVSRIEGKAIALDPSNARLNVSFAGDPSTEGKGNYWIVDLDPDYQWAIVTDFTGLSGFLLTRSRTVSDDFYQELLNRASVKGVKGRITPTRQPAADTVTV